jgi:3-oxoacyl-[acyl-carrier-protein] synthase II
MADRRVVITGLGPVTPVGIGKEAYWNAVLERKSGTRALSHFPWHDKYRISSQSCAPIADFNPQDPETQKRYHFCTREHIDRATSIMQAGAYLALRDAGFEIRKVSDGGGREADKHVLEGVDPFRFSVLLGPGIGGIGVLLTEFLTHLGLGRKKYDKPARPYLQLIEGCMPNASAGELAIVYGAKSESCTVNSACASGLTAAAMAFRSIRLDVADLVLTGGMEAVLDIHEGYVFRAFDAPGALSRWKGDPSQASRPFDEDRKGFVLGEGGAGLVIEELEHARRRGARVYAEILAVSGSCDADHMMRMDKATVQWSVENVIRKAGKKPSDVVYVNAHGTSTELNDQTEADIFAGLFREGPIIRGSKGNIGHLIGGAGPVALCETALTLSERKAAPNINLVKPLRSDIRLPTEVTPLPADLAGKIALTRCSGFGGHNWDIVTAPWLG